MVKVRFAGRAGVKNVKAKNKSSYNVYGEQIVK
jgi:hypothetical protein